MDENILKKQEELVNLFNSAPIKKTLGMSITYEADGRARFDLPHNPNLDHALGGIHGGIISTLLDNAGWFTAAPYFDTWIATVDLNITIIRPVAKEHIYSIGRLIKAGKRIAFSDMEVKTHEADTLIAIGSGTFATTSIPRVQDDTK